MEFLMTTGKTFSTGRDLRSHRWGEHFQDLSGWCQPNKSVDMLAPPSDEQLNTPIITAQDEFDFGVRSSEERFGALMSEVECDPWEEVTSSITTTTTSTTTNTIMPHTQKELWDSVNVWLSTNSPEHDPEFEEIVPPTQSLTDTSCKKQIVKPNGDFLLSQSPVEYRIKTEDINEPSINFSPYLKSAENRFSETNNNYLELPLIKHKATTKRFNNNNSCVKNETGNSLIKNEMGTYNTFYKPIKKESSFDLSLLLQSEEPFINEVESESSCNLSPDCKMSSSPIVISDKDEDMVAAEEVVVTTEDSHLKQEDSITMSFGKTIIKSEFFEMDTATGCNDGYHQQQQPESFKPPPAEIVKNAGRPKLKLDIDAALMSTQSESLDTPEVLRPLVDGIDGFNLLSYVCDDAAINLLSTPPASIICDQASSSATAPPQEKKRGVGRPPGRYQPRLVKKGRKVKEEMVEDEESKPTEEEESLLTPSGRPKRKSAESFKTNIKQRRLTSDTDDLESLSSIDTGIISDDSDESFSTKSRPGRKRKLSKSSSKSSVGRKRKISESDHDSVCSSSDRYRELRDRNNEASRRSRLNRKSREMEMKDQASQLEKDNRLLKIKADEMERLVKKLRENLMQLVLNR